MTGQKPIIRNAKLRHLRRTIVERQELTPHEATHVRWRTDLIAAGGAAALASVIATGAAQAAPRDPDPTELLIAPTPAAEVAVAPVPEPVGPVAPRVRGARPTTVDTEAFQKVSDLKENPYVSPPAKKPKIVKKARMTEPAFARVSDLKANPYVSETKANPYK